MCCPVYISSGCGCRFGFDAALNLSFYMLSIPMMLPILAFWVWADFWSSPTWKAPSNVYPFIIWTHISPYKPPLNHDFLVWEAQKPPGSPIKKPWLFPWLFPTGKRLRGKAKLSEAATALWSHEVGSCFAENSINETLWYFEKSIDMMTEKYYMKDIPCCVSTVFSMTLWHYVS